MNNKKEENDHEKYLIEAVQDYKAKLHARWYENKNNTPKNNTTLQY